MDGNRASRAGQRTALEASSAGRRVHRAGEAAVGVMVPGRAAMRRQHHQRAVFELESSSEMPTASRSSLVCG